MQVSNWFFTVKFTSSLQILQIGSGLRLGEPLVEPLGVVCGIALSIHSHPEYGQAVSHLSSKLFQVILLHVE